MKRFSVKYANQLGTAKKYDELFAYANAHAEKKADAQAFLGLCYDCGYGVNQNRKYAVELFMASSGRGSKIGMFHYAYVLLYGIYVQKDTAQAKGLLRFLANRGILPAQVIYATQCADKEKLVYLTTAARKRYVRAMEELGAYYEKTPELSRKWYLRAVKYNSCYAKYQLAHSYRNYDTTKHGYTYVDEKSFVYWLNEATKHSADTAISYWQDEFCYLNADMQHPYAWATAAHKDLGDFYSQSWNGESIDYQKARFHYEAVIAQDPDEIYSLHMLGEMYHKGLGGAVDKTHAYALFSKSLEIMEKRNGQYGHFLSRALFYVGQACLFGAGTETDYKKAVDYLVQATEMDPESKGGTEGVYYCLGLCHYFGYGTEKNAEEAAKFWKTGSETDCVLSKVALGYLYEKGIAVAQDIPAANELYAKCFARFYYLETTLLRGRPEDYDEDNYCTLLILEYLKLRDNLLEIDRLEALKQENEKMAQNIRRLRQQCLEMSSFRQPMMEQSEQVKKKSTTLIKYL